MIHQILSNKKVVLASESPRRKEIFKLLGLKFLQKSADVDESIHPSDHVNPRNFVIKTSFLKCEDVAKKMDQDCVIIAADTIVYYKKEILGKPESKDQARSYLSRLSGNTHAVYTGISVYYKRKYYHAVEKTSVTFKTLSEKEITDYIQTGEPLDKAGAYGIQGFGAQLVEKINGCYFNVMGFPVFCFYTLLNQLENEIK